MLLEEVSLEEISSGEEADNQELTIKQDLDEAEEKLASALLLPNLPGTEEQRQTIEKRMSVLGSGVC